MISNQGKKIKKDKDIYKTRPDKTNTVIEEKHKKDKYNVVPKNNTGGCRW